MRRSVKYLVCDRGIVVFEVSEFEAAVLSKGPVHVPGLPVHQSDRALLTQQLADVCCEGIEHNMNCKRITRQKLSIGVANINTINMCP